MAYAVAHCKRDVGADAMLHLVIAVLLAGAEIMQGQEGTACHDGAVKVMKALQAMATTSPIRAGSLPGADFFQP